MIITPIRGLSNQVELDTANTVKEFCALCAAADPSSGYIAMPPELQEGAVAINQSMGMVTISQAALIEALERVTEEQITTTNFQRIIGDLERVVSQGESAISDTYSAPAAMVTLWQKNLDLIAQQNRHIDSYVESFRVAFDETCSALLADMASRIIDGEVKHV